jgi:hypothetical protein
MYNVDKALNIIKNNMDALHAEVERLENTPARNERMAAKLERMSAKMKTVISRIESGELPAVNNSTEALGQEIINAEMAANQGKPARDWHVLAADLMNPISTRDIRGM